MKTGRTIKRNAQRFLDLWAENLQAFSAESRLLEPDAKTPEPTEKTTANTAAHDAAHDKAPGHD